MISVVLAVILFLWLGRRPLSFFDGLAAVRYKIWWPLATGQVTAEPQNAHHHDLNALNCEEGTQWLVNQNNQHY